LTVQLPTLTITANGASMTYGGVVPALSVTYSGFINGDTPASLTTAPSVSTTGTSGSRVGNYPITASGAVDPNYNIVYVPGVLAINPAPLTITANPQAKTYGQTPNLGTTAFSSVGLVSGDTIAGVTLSSVGAVPTAGVGSYDIVPSAAAGPRAGNYAITYVNGTLTVNPAPLTITANNASKYFGQTLTFAGTEFVASGLQNGETVGSVTLTSPGAALTATVAGSPYPIQPGAATGGTFAPANYTAINYVNGLLTVKPVGTPPTIASIAPRAGPNTGGTTVIITGTGFEPGATVTFGSLPAALVTFVSSTVLTAVTPPVSSGAVPAVVANPDGNSVTDAGAFTFGLGVAITAQPPASQSVNQGQTATLTVQATGDPTLTYQWQFNGASLLDDGHTSGTKTATLTISQVGPADNATYTCVVSNPYSRVSSAGSVLNVIVPTTVVTVSPAAASVGSGGSVSLTATANGTAPLSYSWYQNGSSTALAGQNGPVLSIANATANATYSVTVGNAAGSSSASATLTILNYCASVQAAQALYPEGTKSIPLSAQTFTCGSPSALVPNSAAVVWIYNSGTSRSVPVTTDSSGNGTALFTPLPTEVGLCQYCVALPGQAAPAPTLSFTIVGMGLSAQSASPHLIVGVPQTQTLQLNNLTATPLTGITGAASGAPSDVTVTVSPPSSLSGNGSGQVTYTLTATGASPSSGQFSILFTSAEGASVTFSVSATMSALTAQLAANPASLSATMVEGSQTLVTFALTNTGGAASGPLSVNLPSGVPWLSVATTQPIPSLDPGQGCQITLALTPSLDLQLGPYSSDLVVEGTSASVAVPFEFTAVSTALGNLQVTVQDELSIYGTPPSNVADATVTVTDFLTGTQMGSQVTDTSGVVTFNDLTSAYYTVAVSAADHGSFSSTVLVQPGTTTPVTAFLALQLVNYTWTVTPTTIPDTYDFTLTTVFVTKVPWPVVTVSPGAINLCDLVLADGSAQVNLVITNSGLITAQGLQIVIDNSNPDWSIVPLTSNLGDLDAEAGILVPVTVTQLGTSTGPGVGSTISASVNWYVAALNATEYNSTPIFIYNANPANCNPSVGSSTPVPPVYVGSNSTGGGGGGGGGGGVPITPGPVVPPVNYSTPSPGAVVSVTLQIDQTAVISRNAFNATLNLANNSGAPVTDLQVTINPVDASGNPAPNAFFIQTPVLSGINAVDGTGSLAIGASGQANWTLIPTTTAAPTGTTQYGIGGSISYTLNGQQVIIPLFPVTISVLPDPQLYLDYFLQHDVYSQDPFTTVVEQEEPFALGLRVRNLGLGMANDFTITSAQPTIIDNRNGLLIGFQIISSQVGTSTTPVPSLTLDLGDINPATSAVGIWWMTASLEGSFTNFQATFQHSDALGGLETSLISGVNIHEMNHVVRITTPIDDGIPDFLCNDTTVVDALPDDVYSSDGNVYPVTSLTGAVASGPVSAGSLTITVNDVADIIPSGFVYFQFPDPSGGQFTITSVTRSDGTSLLVGPNVWQTPYRPNMVPPQMSALVHIFDYDSTGSYTITFAPPSTLTAPISADIRVCPETSNTANGPAGATSYSWTITGGTFTSAATGQTVTYTSGASGTVVLTLEITDAAGDTAYNTVAIAIDGPPIPATDLWGTIQNQSVTVPVMKVMANATSPSGGTLSIPAVSPASAQGGAVALVGDNITYTPPAGYVGQDSFTYTLSAGCSAATAQGTVSVTIAPAGAATENEPAISLSGGCVNLVFHVTPGFTYRVQWSANAGGPWTDFPLPDLTPNSTGQIFYSDCTSPMPPQRFYKTRLGP
jgi:hypothetical protein